MSKRVFWVMWWMTFVVGIAGTVVLAYVAFHFISRVW